MLVKVMVELEELDDKDAKHKVSITKVGPGEGPYDELAVLEVGAEAESGKDKFQMSTNAEESEGILVKIEEPPLVYDREQGSALPGEWPTEATEEQKKKAEEVTIREAHEAKVARDMGLSRNPMTGKWEDTKEGLTEAVKEREKVLGLDKLHEEENRKKKEKEPEAQEGKVAQPPHSQAPASAHPSTAGSPPVSSKTVQGGTEPRNK